jgi:hypothetical protein
MLKLRITLALLISLIAGGRVLAQPVYYNTSSATQALNTLANVTTNGSSSTNLFTATGAGGNNVSRCTAAAVDGLNNKLFFADAGSNAIWRVNIDGTGLTLIKGSLTNCPTDLALDVLNQKIYFTTSSTITNNNTIQQIDYTGNNGVTLFTATGPAGNGASRCTALAVDLLNAKIFLADAVAQKIWSLPLAGGSPTALATTTNAYPTSLALDTTNQQVYFTASSTAQSSNVIQRVNYNGTGLITRFTAASGVQRCTALDLDLAQSIIYLSDAGASTLWRIPLGGGSATTLLSGLTSTAKKVRWFSGPTTRPPPGITGMNLAGINPTTQQITINATNGFVGGSYFLLTSTNIAKPLNQWLPVLTNVLGASGNFIVTATNAAFYNTPQQFYILGVQ